MIDDNLEKYLVSSEKLQQCLNEDEVEPERAASPEVDKRVLDVKANALVRIKRRERSGGALS